MFDEDWDTKEYIKNNTFRFQGWRLLHWDFVTLLHDSLTTIIPRNMSDVYTSDILLKSVLENQNGRL